MERRYSESSNSEMFSKVLHALASLGLDIADIMQLGQFITDEERSDKNISEVQSIEEKEKPQTKVVQLSDDISKQKVEVVEEEDEDVSEEEEEGSVSDSEDSFSIKDMVPSQTNAVLKLIDQSIEARKRDEIREQLDRIIDRIEITLIHSGDDGVIPRDPDQAIELFNQVEKGPEFSLEKRKAELNYKQQFITNILSFAKSQEERKTILDEVNDWLTSCDDVVVNCLSEEQWEHREEALSEIVDGISSAFDCANSATDKIHAIGIQLLKDAGYIDPDDDEESKKMRKMRPFDMENVIEEDDLEKDEKLQDAMKEIKLILDQAIRFVRMQQHKNVMRAGIKQYKFLMKNIAKRVEDYDLLKEEMDSIKTEYENLVISSDHYKAQNEEDKEKIKDLQDQNEALEVKLRDLVAENSELQSIVAQLESYKEQTISSTSNEPIRCSSVTLSRKTSNTGESSSTMGRTRSRTTVSSPLLSKHDAILTQSMINAVTKSMQEDLEKTKKELADTKQALETAEQQLNFAYEEIEQLNARLEMMDEISGETSDLQSKLKQEAKNNLMTIRNERDTYEKQVACLLTEVSCKNELIEFQEGRLKSMKEDLGMVDVQEMKSFSNLKTKDGKPIPDDVKNMLVFMKKDMTSELDRLRKHLEKEKLRHEAAMRKQEKKHKDDLGNIHKSSIHLLRAINRFKESTAVILEREALPKAAGEIRRIQNLPTEDTGTDVKQLLMQMAGNAVELLVSLEFKLSQALMNKRLEVKDKNIAKNFATKDLETQMEAAQRAKKAAESMAGTMKEMKSKLAAAEEAIMEMRNMEDDRYKGLAERYRKLMYQYTGLQKENAKMELEAKQNMKNKTKALNQMSTAKNSMAQLVEEQKGMITQMHRLANVKKDQKSIDMQLSIVDQKQNLDILEKALKENKISKEMYTMTVDLIKQSMDLPLLKLRSLFRKYISYRRLQDVKAYIRHQLTDEAHGDRKEELEEYMCNMDAKLERDNQAWQKEMTKLEHKRKNMFGEMTEVFTDVIIETGVMLIVPEDKLMPIPSETSMDSGGKSGTSSGSSEQKRTRKYKLLPNISRKSPHMEMPSELVGRSLSRAATQSKSGDTLWKVNAPRMLPPIRKNMVETPRILEYDIQRQLKAAQRALAGIHHRSKYPLGTVTGCDYSFDKVTPLSMLSDTGYGDSDSGSLDTSSHYTSYAGSEGQDSAIDNTMVNIRVDIKVKDHHYVSGTNIKNMN